MSLTQSIHKINFEQRFWVHVETNRNLGNNIRDIIWTISQCALQNITSVPVVKLTCGDLQPPLLPSVPDESAIIMTMAMATIEIKAFTTMVTQLKCM